MKIAHIVISGRWIPIAMKAAIQACGYRYWTEEEEPSKEAIASAENWEPSEEDEE